MKIRGYSSRLCVPLWIVGFLLTSSSAAEASITLAWDPSPDSDVIAYRVYVGTESGAYSESYDVEMHQTSFVYTSTGAGIRYYFAVASIGSDGEPGWPSEEVSGLDSSLGSVPPVSKRTGRESGPSERVCTAAAGIVCYTAETLATGLGAASALTPTVDGRLFFIEDHRRVRVLAHPDARPEIALETHRDITTMALDPTFAETGLVIVGESEPRQGRGHELRIVRYREVNGAFGEGAAVVTGLELAAGAVAPMAVDADRRIYVALPAATERRSGDPYAGHLLGFDADGSVPAGTTGGSPVLVPAFAEPAGLASVSSDRQLWLAGSHPRGAASLAYLDLSASGARAWHVIHPPVPGEVTSVTIAQEGERRDERALFLIAADSRLYRGVLTPGGLTAAAPVALDRLGVPVAVGAGEDGIYVAVRLQGVADGAGTFAILKLTR